VLDNLSAPRAAPVHRWLVRQPRVQFHFTPTYASWLNLVERFFGWLTERAPKRGSHTSVPKLRAAILAYVDAHDERGMPCKWVWRTPSRRVEARSSRPSAASAPHNPHPSQSIADD
jgi:hypothetical protein